MIGQARVLLLPDVCVGKAVYGCLHICECIKEWEVQPTVLLITSQAAF